jgi:transketolase
MVNEISQKKIKRNVEKKSYYEKLDLNKFSSMRDGFGEAILDLGKENKNIVALTADLKPSLKLDNFEKKFPKRFFEFGISEQNMMAAAAGMSLLGKIPFVTSFAVFNPGRNWDQLRVAVCYSNHNVKIIGSHAGLTTGEDGATHQALEDIAITRCIPNLVVLVPSDREQTYKAIRWAGEYEGPVYIRFSREKALEIYQTKKQKEKSFQFGKINILEKGDDVTIISCGLMVRFALEASVKLKKIGIKATVVDCPIIKPLDEAGILSLAKRTKAFVTVEEHQKFGGMGSAISELIVEKYPIPIEIIGVNDSFGESGNGYDLLKKYNLTSDEIVKRVKKVLKRKN